MTAALQADRLSIDFGSSNTVAMLHWPGGQVRPVLFDGAHLLASAVYAQADGSLLTGADAVRSASLEPERFEPTPKRRIDDGTVLLGDREVATVDLIAAVLRRVAYEVVTTYGSLPPTITVTCPARWASPRRKVLTEAAARAGLGPVRLIEEPVAAAVRLVQIGERNWPTGSAVVVYDLGGGTCDISVIRLTAKGPEVVAVGGRDNVGGLDFDALIVERAGALCAPHDHRAWQALTDPTTGPDRRLRRMLWEDARSAKEQLSRHATAHLHVPKLETDLHVTREEFELLARPLLEPTVTEAADIVRRARIAPSDLAAVLLVGGSSRIPLVATLLHQRLGIAPIVLEQPETVVAEGAVLTTSGPEPMVEPPSTGDPAVDAAVTEDVDGWPSTDWEPEPPAPVPFTTAMRRVRWPVRALWFAGSAQVLCALVVFNLVEQRLSVPDRFDVTDLLGSLAYLFVAGAGVGVLMAFNALDNRKVSGQVGPWLIVATGLTTGTQVALMSLGVQVSPSLGLTLILVMDAVGFIGAILTTVALRPLGALGWVPAIGFVGSMLFTPFSLLLPVGLGIALLTWLIHRAATRTDAETAAESPDAQEATPTQESDALPSGATPA